MNAATAFGLLRSLDLPLDDFAVFGSGPLLVRGIINDANDLDVIARNAAWAQATANGELTYLPEHGITVASFFDGAVTVGDSWAIGDVDVSQLIDSAEVLEGLPFVRLEHVITYKRVAGRPKDLDHLRRIDEWLDGSRASRPSPGVSE